MSCAGFSLWVLVVTRLRHNRTNPHRLKPASLKSLTIDRNMKGTLERKHSPEDPRATVSFPFEVWFHADQ